MKLNEAKDQVAREYGYKEWNEAIIKAPSVAVRMVDEAMKLYASEKVKEALQLAGERATAHTESRFPSVHYCECCPVVDPESILSLETELLKQINEEI